MGITIKMRINLNDKIFRNIKEETKKHEGVNSIQLIEFILTAYLDGINDNEKLKLSEKK